MKVDADGQDGIDTSFGQVAVSPSDWLREVGNLTYIPSPYLSPSIESTPTLVLQFRVFTLSTPSPTALHNRRHMMSSWMNNLRNLGRQANPTRPNAPPSRGNTSSPSAYSPSSQGPLPSPSHSSTTMAQNDQAHQSNQGPQTSQSSKKNIPYFFREQCAGFVVKGNFMTLAAKPQLVEEGEWLAHQIVEQNRQLGGMLKIIQAESTSHGRALCNEQVCPSMTAGNVIYSWIDTNRNPINLPAPTYMKHIQTWVAGKCQDESIFPTSNLPPGYQFPAVEQVSKDANSWIGKTSGFPQRFENEIKNMYKQMFRCYAHIYHSHWIVFWDNNIYRELNTHFLHFVNVGLIFGLLNARDIEPMLPLVEIWAHRGDLPSWEAATAAAEERAVGATSTPTSAPGSSAGQRTSA